MNILDQIKASKRLEVEELKITHPLGTLAVPKEKRLGQFTQALMLQPDCAVIAELKKASPSKGLLSPAFHVPNLAREYALGGAAALSVLTEQHFFLGKPEYLRAAKEASGLPVLCKDFLIDSYQLSYAAAMGADAILLIVRMLNTLQLKQFLALAKSLGLDALVEVHTDEELRVALGEGATLIGVNNRDLKTFAVDLRLAERLAPLFPKDVIAVCESGISQRSDIVRMREYGYCAFLIGEALITAASPHQLLKELRGVA